MNNNKKLRILTIISAALFAVMIVGVIVTLDHRPKLTQEESLVLRQDFPIFISERLAKEKPGAEFIKLELLGMDRTSDGNVKIDYELSYNDKTKGKPESTTTLHAQAILQGKGQEWKTLKVNSIKEDITIKEAIVINK